MQWNNLFGRLNLYNISASNDWWLIVCHKISRYRGGRLGNLYHILSINYKP